MAASKAPPLPASSRAARSGSSAGGESAVFFSRLRRLADAVAKQELTHLLVTNPKDVGYLTGFLGGDSYLFLAAAGVSQPSRPIVISDFRYKEELEPLEQGGIASIFIRSKSMSEAITEIIGSGKGDGGTGGVGADARIGVQAEQMTIAERAGLSRRVGAKRLVDTTGLVAALRVIKDAGEVALIRKAAKIQEAALNAVLPKIKPGLSELEVAAMIESEMKCRGSSEPGFQTIVAAGANGSLPHYRPGPKKVSAGKPLLIDWGAVYKGYHSDMTRTFSMGKWPAKVREIYQIVLDAQEQAAAALAPGKTTVQIDAVARQHIMRHGYAEFFGHGLGHGIGLNGHEDPRVTNMLGPTALVPGMVVTVEPGIYLPGVGGVRLEDDYVITEDGATNLCSLPKDLEWATL